MKDHPKILIVEDDQDIRANIRLYLSSLGIICVEAFDGAEAVDAAKREKPDLILLDIILPIINGYQVCKMLKGDPEYKSIPIIMLSAKAEKADKDRGMQSGCDAYIIKPFEFDNLEKTIKKFLKK